MLDSVLRNELRHFYKLFYHMRHGNSEFDSTLQNSVWLEILGTTKSYDLWNGDVHHMFTNLVSSTLLRDNFGGLQLLHNLCNGHIHNVHGGSLL